MGRLTLPLLIAVAVVASACTSEEAAPLPPLGELPRGEAVDYGPGPTVTDTPLDPEVDAALTHLFDNITTLVERQDLLTVIDSGDPRMAWLLADLLRFFQGADQSSTMIAGFETLTGAEIDRSRPWSSATNHLIAWDLPEPPDYLRFKRTLFTAADPRWAPFFVDDAAVDFRHVSWGGVLIDDRPVGDDTRCTRGCIPALDDPETTPASEGDWYPDDAIVFGVEIDGEARAYPKNMMEVHEMVNDSLGGRRFGMPYCTLCGSAQAYYTDNLPPDLEQPLLRTSGLLIRSNKMMFDLRTMSLIDTFLGNATSGPLLEAGIELEQISVVTTTWGQWRAEHPATTILAEDGGVGRSYDLDPLRGRDDDGPIFPIGDADTRLPVQEPVLGVKTESGRAVAFHIASAKQALAAGAEVEVENIRLELDAGGVRAVTSDGDDAGGHQAFWFAWSQFEPDTALWPEDFTTPEPEG